jgi:hypothetical protein
MWWADYEQQTTRHLYFFSKIKGLEKINNIWPFVLVFNKILKFLIFLCFS